jgi:5'-methylthioadenosine phosphorylase
VFHVPFADPYDVRLRAELVRAGAEAGVTTHDGGTLVVIQGPRFSTRAESAWFRSMGWTVVNMTGYPEAVLAAEAGIPYAAVALVTDYDAGLDGVEPVTQEQVFSFFEQNLVKVRELLMAGIPRVALR